jgi:uncharacterized protein (DUF2235 family)
MARRSKLRRGAARNIVIFSDGTGQRGGLYFDEERTNVYKLYRATRVAPDSRINPDKQMAFYDPGLGTLRDAGGGFEQFFRKIYNFISQATGLGITRNIIDCYAALIRLWRPGDRIFLFGFSRGAYTVRCLASVICMCGIPTTGKDGKPLARDRNSSKALAARAVKTVYQHVSSPRDQKYLAQRVALAAAFRNEYSANAVDGSSQSNVYPYFIGVFDTVAALSNKGSLILLCIAYVAIHIAVATGLALVSAHFDSPSEFEHWFWYWFGWSAVWAFCVAVAAYVYTHLKFAWHLPGFYFWDVIHLTDFRQKFYDQYLNPHILYARHALSIDERRHDFKRVPWGGKQRGDAVGVHKIEPFQQLWFAGNHADIGGGYPENESRLSDIALSWMIDEASNPALGNKRLIVDSSVLDPNGRADGIQHDETRSAVFRWAKKTFRNPVPDATVHASVSERFKLKEVQQYDFMAPYRPEPLRNHKDFQAYYENVPLPHVTCWQRISLQYRRLKKIVGKTVGDWLSQVTRSFYPEDWKTENAMSARRLTPDSIASCLGLALLAFFVGWAGWILIFCQIIPWLREDVWYSYPISAYLTLQTSWVGLQLIIDWVWKLPMSLLLAVVGVVFFRLFGILSAKLYEWASRGEEKKLTPSQTQAY